MTQSATTTPVGSDEAVSSLVAGIVLRSSSEQDADKTVHDVVDRLAPHVPPSEVTVATHWVSVEDERRCCLSVELPAAESGPIWRILVETMPPGGDTVLALCMGERHAGPDGVRAASAAAAQAHVARSSGRAVRFPGVSALVGTMSVRQLLTESSIDRVRVLAAGDADPDMLVVTRDHVRPLWSGGQLVLTTQPAMGETLVPFESPDPTPCCADHR